MRVAQALSPDQPDHNFGAGIAGKPDPADIGLPLCHAQSGRLNAARIGTGQFDARALLTGKRPHGIHLHRVRGSDRLKRIASKAARHTAAGPPAPRLRRRRGGHNRVRELSVGQHLGPDSRRGRFHVPSENHRIHRRAGLGCIDRDLDAFRGSGQRLPPLLHHGGARHGSF